MSNHSSGQRALQAGVFTSISLKDESIVFTERVLPRMGVGLVCASILFFTVPWGVSGPQGNPVSALLFFGTFFALFKHRSLLFGSLYRVVVRCGERGGHGDPEVFVRTLHELHKDDVTTIVLHERRHMSSGGSHLIMIFLTTKCDDSIFLHQGHFYRKDKIESMARIISTRLSAPLRVDY